MSNSIKLCWGRDPQLVFGSINDYYRALGHLANPEAYSISYEYNQKNGSYSDACRIHILSKATNIPEAFERKKTTGKRINCNDYVNNLELRHNFVRSGNEYIQNFDAIFSTVPNEFISDFLVGYNESSKKDSAKRVCYSVEAINVDKKDLRLTSQPTKTRKSVSKRTIQKQKKRDYIFQYITDFEIGEAGESLVYKYECEKVEEAKKQGKLSNTAVVKWVSRDDDLAGYDIMSYDIEKGTEKYIEVKTTAGGKSTPFYISDRELLFSKNHADKYCIYRIFGIKNNTSSIQFYIIEGNIEDNANYELCKKDYLVTIKNS